MATVLGADRADIPELVAIAEATTKNAPAAAWLVPDPRYRSGVLRAWYAVLFERALRHGQIDVLADRSAAAIWLDRTRPRPPIGGMYLRRLTSTCGKHAIALLRYEDHLDRHRPHRAHLHLAVLAAAEPEPAAALLAHRHQFLDQAGVGAHAAVDTVAQLLVMTAAGYLPRPAMRLPDGGPLMRPLWRAPHPDRTAAAVSAARAA